MMLSEDLVHPLDPVRQCERQAISSSRSVPALIDHRSSGGEGDPAAFPHVRSLPPPVNKEGLIASSSLPIHSNYIVREKVGQGTWGSVHVAVERSSGLERVVKKIPKRFSSELPRFRQEMMLLKGLDHPNIVRLYEMFEDYANIYMVLEYCRGGELFDRVTNCRYFSEATAALLCYQMINSTCYIHRKRIVHRDLKPENFLFLEDDERSPLKLIDFGLARRFTSRRRMRTRVGTLYYVSPEVVNGSYDEKCDIWSIGVILYLLLCGSPPFNGPTDAMIINQVRHGELKFAESTWKNVTELAQDFLRQLLHRDPTQRPSAEAALRHPWFTVFRPPTLIAMCFPRPLSMPCLCPQSSASNLLSPNKLTPRGPISVQTSHDLCGDYGSLTKTLGASPTPFVPPSSLPAKAPPLMTRITGRRTSGPGSGIAFNAVRYSGNTHRHGHLPRNETALSLASGCCIDEEKGGYMGGANAFASSTSSTPFHQVPGAQGAATAAAVVTEDELKQQERFANMARQLVPRWRRFAKHNQLKKAALRVVAQQLYDGAELADLRSFFLALDLRHDGTLTIDELRDSLSLLQVGETNSAAPASHQFYVTQGTQNSSAIGEQASTDLLARDGSVDGREKSRCVHFASHRGNNDYHGKGQQEGTSRSVDYRVVPWDHVNHENNSDNNNNSGVYPLTVGGPRSSSPEGGGSSQGGDVSDSSQPQHPLARYETRALFRNLPSTQASGAKSDEDATAVTKGTNSNDNTHDNSEQQQQQHRQQEARPPPVKGYSSDFDEAGAVNDDGVNNGWSSPGTSSLLSGEGGLSVGSRGGGLLPSCPHCQACAHDMMYDASSSAMSGTGSLLNQGGGGAEDMTMERGGNHEPGAEQTNSSTLDVSLVNEVALDGGESLDYSDFLATMMDPDKLMQDSFLRAAFRVFDRDGDGRINVNELRASLGWLDPFQTPLDRPRGENGHAAIEKEMRRILSASTASKDGSIDFDDFIALVRRESESDTLSTRVGTPTPLSPPPASSS